MARRLFTVEDRFSIKGRGLVPVPGIVPQGAERFRVGDPIMIRRPDGSCLGSTIAGIEMVHASPPRPKNEIVIVLKDLSKEDVPIGSEIWSTDA